MISTYYYIPILNSLKSTKNKEIYYILIDQLRAKIEKKEPHSNVEKTVLILKLWPWDVC